MIEKEKIELSEKNANLLNEIKKLKSEVCLSN